jgi:uncharacterized metal-binding protein YceD (DUF177 family)
MRIDLNKLPATGRHTVALADEHVAAWNGGTGFEAVGVCADLSFAVRGQRVRWQGSIGGRVSTSCGSCGTPVAAEVSIEVGLTLVPAADLADQATSEKFKNDEGLWGYEIAAEAAEETGYESPEVDLTGWLEDEWRLGLPALLRCTDCECRGAAAQSERAETPIDPRWAGLQALRDQMGSANPRTEDRGE